jgi:hypothetical protein
MKNRRKIELKGAKRLGNSCQIDRKKLIKATVHFLRFFGKTQKIEKN